MKIIYKDPLKLNPYINNPRNNEHAVEAVAESIKQFGFKVPITIDADGIVVTGHTRLKAAIRLGLTEVPVIILDDLTKDQVKAFRLADNKVSELSQWDMDKLAIELEEIEMDMSLFDFEIAPVQVELLEDNDFDPTPPKKPDSKPGDIVLDTFGGSGSTLITAEQLNRTCYMMELDPKYADVIIKRYEELTGDKAIRIKEGGTKK